MNETKPLILAVDDDADLRIAIRDILETEDYQVRIAENGAQALELLRQNRTTPPDVIISDIVMPGMNGFEFLEEVRQEDEWVMIPFIFLTAKEEKTDQYKGTMLGADVYITKPFEIDDLIVAVKGRLQRSQKMREVQSSEIEDLKRNILRVLNHEFRTPLSMVVSYADMLKDFDSSNMDDADLLVFLQEMNQGASRLRTVVENFIVLIELEGDEARTKFERRKSPIKNVRNLIENACRSALGEDYGQHCAVTMSDPLPIIVGDKFYLSKMLQELITNAVKFSTEEDVIHISVSQEDGSLIMQIRDHGRGIPPTELERIWTAFYQYDRQQYEDQGVGVGLAIVRGIIELHDGELDVDSIPGQGSTFTVRLKAQPS